MHSTAIKQEDYTGNPWFNSVQTGLPGGLGEDVISRTNTFGTQGNINTSLPCRVIRIAKINERLFPYEEFKMVWNIHGYKYTLSIPPCPSNQAREPLWTQWDLHLNERQCENKGKEWPPLSQMKQCHPCTLETNTLAAPTEFYTLFPPRRSPLHVFEIHSILFFLSALYILTSINHASPSPLPHSDLWVSELHQPILITAREECLICCILLPPLPQWLSAIVEGI